MSTISCIDSIVYSWLHILSSSLTAAVIIASFIEAVASLLDYIATLMQ